MNDQTTTTAPGCAPTSGSDIPPAIRAKMNADRKAARAKMPPRDTWWWLLESPTHFGYYLRRTPRKTNGKVESGTFDPHEAYTFSTCAAAVKYCADNPVPPWVPTLHAFSPNAPHELPPTKTP